LVHRTTGAQFSKGSPRKVTFPLEIQHRKLTVTIYGRSPTYEFYRVSVQVGGKRVVSHFNTFGEAKKSAKAKLRELAKGNPAAGLSAKEAAEALTIREALTVSTATASLFTSVPHRISFLPLAKSSMDKRA